MKNFILGVLATFCLLTIFAFTPAGQSLITVKPATPKQTKCFICHGKDCVKYVNLYSKEGFIVSNTARSYDSDNIITMYKY